MHVLVGKLSKSQKRKARSQAKSYQDYYSENCLSKRPNDRDEEGGGPIVASTNKAINRVWCSGCRAIELHPANKVHGQKEPYCDQCSEKVAHGEIPIPLWWSLATWFTGLDTCGQAAIEAVARGGVGPFFPAYMIEDHDLCHAYIDALCRHPKYAGMRPNQRLYDFNLVDFLVLLRVTLVIITGPCDRFCSYLRGKGVAMGSNDLFTKLLYMRAAAAILMRKFRVGIIENIEAFLKSECFQMIRDACAKVGSRLIISPLNAWDLGSPFNRPRLFCYVIDKDVTSWCEDKFWQELEKSVLYESRTELLIKDMVITTKKEREYYSMTDEHIARLKSLSANDKRKIAEATKHLKANGREQWFAIDLSQEGWCKLHKTEGRLPTYTSSSRIYITHKSMERCFSPVECGIGMTMEKLPLKVLCQLLVVHTKRGMRKLQVLLANLAQPSCMRVALDALMITIPDELIDESSLK